MSPHNNPPPPWWESGKQHVCARDPILAAIIDQYGPEAHLVSLNDPWRTLVRSVVSQQISTHAANAIWERLNQHNLTSSPGPIIQTPEADLRALGLSGRKVEYLQNLASWIQDQDQDFLVKGDWSQVRTSLIAQRGIGPWSCQMFAMFCRLEPDELPLADIGLHKALSCHYALDIKNKSHETKIQALSQKWAPYRTLATWYLWRSLDPYPIAY